MAACTSSGGGMTAIDNAEAAIKAADTRRAQFHSRHGKHKGIDSNRPMPAGRNIQKIGRQRRQKP